MKTILATAYAVNPYKGSEDGMGWNFIYQIARFQKVIAITRENNHEHILRYMNEHPDPVYNNIQFEYFDLPYYLRFWKKGNFGAMLYFWLWQKQIPGFVKQKKLQFDIAHNVNFHNDWTPSYLWKLDKPFVWGPVGHHPQIPSHYLKQYSIRYHCKEKITWAIKHLFWNHSRSLQYCVSSANHILCMNSEVEKALPIKTTARSIMPSVATEDRGFFKQKNPGFTLISVGRLVPLKGFDLSILSFANFLNRLSPDDQKKCRLIIVGDGPEKKTLEQLVSAEKIQTNVMFVPWMKRSELLQLYSTAHAFLFPSHEGAGMVVAEALSFGLPVICLNNSGPGEFITEDCGVAVPQSGYASTVKSLSNAILEFYQQPTKLLAMSANARTRFEEHFNWDNRGYQLHQLYTSIQP